MKRVKLTKNQYALVDDEDFEELNREKWYTSSTGYATRRNRKKMTYMHRTITNCPQGMQVDHINGNRLDNQRINLRVVTSQQNKQNRHRNLKGKTSKYKGVSWNKKNQNWYARIKINCKQIYLGCFIDEVQAALEYDKKAIELFGEYARPNFIQKDNNL